jgi:GTPase
MYHKSGFVNIIGHPNVGKSTLLNNLVGKRLSIITPKLQTTRHRIIGILNNVNYQIIFYDTPGIISYKHTLHKFMMNYVKKSLTDVDIILYMIDAKNEKINKFIKTIKNISTSLIVLINKIDIINSNCLETIVNTLHNYFPVCQILPISAKYKINLDLLLNKIISLLPKSKAYYPKNFFTDKNKMFFVNEIIREKILLLYKNEIPYSTNVINENIYSNDNLIKINSIITLEKESQKIILIGHKGRSLSKLIYYSKIDLEYFFKKKIFLKFYIKILTNWRLNELYIKKYVYPY